MKETLTKRTFQRLKKQYFCTTNEIIEKREINVLGINEVHIFTTTELMFDDIMIAYSVNNGFKTEYFIPSSLLKFKKELVQLTFDKKTYYIDQNFELLKLFKSESNMSNYDGVWAHYKSNLNKIKGLQ